MTNYHPIFPLEVVVYPGEKLNLHIFEPRYIYMIKKAVELNKPFVMGVMLNQELQEMGTLVQVAIVRNEYEDGKMDITIEGLYPVKVLELIKSESAQLPHHAIVFHPKNEISKGVNAALQRVYDLMLTLHQALNVSKKLDKPLEDMMSYDLAHHIGLPFDEEYRLLTFLKEEQRLELLRLHLVNLIATVENIASLRDKVRMNGSFRHLKGFDFD